MRDFKVTRTVTTIDNKVHSDTLKIFEDGGSSLNALYISTSDLPNLIKKLQEVQKQYATN